MSASTAERLRALRARKKLAAGKELTDIERAQLAQYEREHPRGGARTSSPRASSPPPAPAWNPHGEQREMFPGKAPPMHTTELLGSVTAAQFASVPRVVSAGGDDGKPGVETPIVGATQKTPEQLALEQQQAAQRAMFLGAGLAAYGVKVVRELVELRGDAPQFIVDALRSDEASKDFPLQVGAAFGRLAVKYGVARVFPYEDEFLFVGTLLCTGGAHFALRDLKKKIAEGKHLPKKRTAAPPPAARAAADDAPPPDGGSGGIDEEPAPAPRAPHTENVMSGLYRRAAARAA